METVQKSGAYDVCASLFSPHRYEDHSNFPVLIMEDSSLDQQIVASVKAAAEDYIYDNDPEAIDFESSKDYTEEEIQKFGKENDWAFQVRYFLEHPSTMRMVKELTELMNSKNTRTNENDSSAQKNSEEERPTRSSMQQGQGRPGIPKTELPPSQSQDHGFVEVESKRSKRAKKKKTKKASLTAPPATTESATEAKEERELPVTVPPGSRPLSQRRAEAAQQVAPLPPPPPAQTGGQPAEYSEDGARVVGMTSGALRVRVSFLSAAVEDLQARLTAVEAQAQAPVGSALPSPRAAAAEVPGERAEADGAGERGEEEEEEEEAEAERARWAREAADRRRRARHLVLHGAPAALAAAPALLAAALNRALRPPWAPRGRGGGGRGRGGGGRRRGPGLPRPLTEWDFEVARLGRGGGGGQGGGGDGRCALLVRFRDPRARAAAWGARAALGRQLGGGGGGGGAAAAGVAVRADLTPWQRAQVARLRAEAAALLGQGSPPWAGEEGGAAGAGGGGGGGGGAAAWAPALLAVKGAAVFVGGRRRRWRECAAPLGELLAGRGRCRPGGGRRY